MSKSLCVQHSVLGAFYFVVSLAHGISFNSVQAKIYSAFRNGRKINVYSGVSVS